jgi:hypothetical protein
MADIVLINDPRFEVSFWGLDYAARRPRRGRLRQARRLVEAGGFALRLLWQVPEWRLRQVYRRRLAHLWHHRREPLVLRVYAIKCAMHYHAHRLVEALQQRGGRLNTY